MICPFTNKETTIVGINKDRRLVRCDYAINKTGLPCHIAELICCNECAVDKSGGFIRNLIKKTMSIRLLFCGKGGVQKTMPINPVAFFERFKRVSTREEQEQLLRDMVFSPEEKQLNLNDEELQDHFSAIVEIAKKNKMSHILERLLGESK